MGGREGKGARYVRKLSSLGVSLVRLFGLFGAASAHSTCDLKAQLARRAWTCVLCGVCVYVADVAT
jgi:hypothetical protein